MDFPILPLFLLYLNSKNIQDTEFMKKARFQIGSNVIMYICF